MRVIPRTSVGIEISGRDLRIVVLRDFAGKRRVMRTDVLPGFIDLSDDDRVAALGSLVTRNKLPHGNVYLTLPAAWGVTRDLEFPAAVGENLRSAVALQVENLSPWGLDEIYWDCAWEPAKKGRRSILVHVAIVPHKVLDPWIASLRSAGLALTGASLSSLSWAHAVSVLWGPGRPTLVLSSEENHVEGALVQDDRVHAVGADRMEGVEASQLAASTASQLLRAGRVEASDQIRLVGYGSTSAESGMESVRLPLVDASEGSSAFGAISAALFGIVRSGFRVNLVPGQLRYQRNYAQLLPTYGLIGLLVLLGLFAWLREPYQLSLYAAQLDQESQRLAGEVRSVADQEAQLNGMSDRLKTLEGHIRGRDANLQALRELSRVLPPGTFLTSYQCQDNVVTISGFSDSAASIQKLLEDSPVFRDAQFASSITRDSTGKDRFVIRTSVEVAG